MNKTKVTSVISTFILCYGCWILFSFSFTAQELAAGAVISLGVALFSARFLIHENSFYLFNIKRILLLLFYCLVIFPKELWKANLDVAKRALNPGIPVKPGIVKIPSGLKSEYGLAMLANSITLTPGTITMDIVDEGGKIYYYVHWIDAAFTNGKQAGEAIKGNLEDWIRRIFK